MGLGLGLGLTQVTFSENPNAARPRFVQRMHSTCTSNAHAIARARAGPERTGPAPSPAIAAATAASFDLPLPDNRFIRCSSAWSSRPALTRAVRRGELEAAVAVAVVVAVAGALTAAAAAPAFCSSRANDRASVTPGPVQNSSGASASRNRTVSRVVFLNTVSWTSVARAVATEESCHCWAQLVPLTPRSRKTPTGVPTRRSERPVIASLSSIRTVQRQCTPCLAPSSPLEADGRTSRSRRTP